MRFEPFSLLAMASIIADVSAYFRMPCHGRLVRERLDPVVNPGNVSGHVHNIVGGSAFGAFMNYNQTQRAACSSCTIKEDKSNYWTPQLYYHSPNGSFLPVPVVGNGDDTNAGMLVYYLQRPGKKDKLEDMLGFPRGFRMLAGDTTKRSFTGGLDAKAVSFRCLQTNQSLETETNEIPSWNCEQGLRAQIFFPSCWNGLELDSVDHRSHMSYFAGDQYNTGDCPPTHPKHMISLFYEVLYDTNRFKNMWYNTITRPNGSHPFVFANGDATGYGFHADFVNGWDIEVLQNATVSCTDDSGNVGACPIVSEYTYDECNACKLPPVVDERMDGWFDALPGCNPVSHGPASAPKPTNCTPSVGLGPPVKNYVDLTTSFGWKYAGCASDNVVNRTLSLYWPVEARNMTVEKCINHCAAEVGIDYTYAGVEYGGECFCGTQLRDESRAPKPGIYGNCNMKCSGNGTQTCGGPSALSLYQKCRGDAGGCQNYEFVQFPAA